MEIGAAWLIKLLHLHFSCMAVGLLKSSYDSIYSCNSCHSLLPVVQVI